MEKMTTDYLFLAGYTKTGKRHTPSSIPTVDIWNTATDALLVTGGTVTQSAVVLGGCSYVYSGADGLKLVGIFHTEDDTIDQRDLYSYNPIPVISSSVAVSATVAASVSSGFLAIETACTFRQSITSTLASDLSAATKLWLAIKSSEIVTDAASTIFVEKTGGLTVVNGAPYATIANGSLTISGSSGAWSVAVYLSEVVTALLSAGKYVAELKAKIGTDEVSVWAGECVISTGVVQTL
jgi:hypothetical protein